jgi:hypothetical protein
MVVRPMCLTFSIPGICVDGWWLGVENVSVRAQTASGG